MNKEQIKEKVYEIIRKHSQFGQENMAMDKDLKDHYGIDSISLVDVIIEIESETGILIDSEVLTYDRLSTIGAILEYVYEKMKKAG